MTNKFDAAAIIAGLDGNAATGMCRCPAHDDKNPSLHVSDGPAGKVLVKCHARCSQFAIINALRQLNLWPTRGRPAEGSHANGSRHRDEAQGRDDDNSDYKRFIRASNILRTAAQSGPISPVEYLNSRGITIIPKCIMLLDAVGSAQYIGPHYPAMVAPIVDAKRLIGATTTLLTRDATAKAECRTPRKFFGNLKRGYVICGEADPDRPLIIAEGIESTLSAMQLAGLPGIAALSAGNMPAVRPPRCSEVIIAADNDKPGRDAAAELAERLRYEGIAVHIALPPIEGEDWNDVLLRNDESRATTIWQEALLATSDTEPSKQIFALDEESFMGLAFPERKMFLEPWLPHPGLAMLHAPRGEGKTWFALAVAKAVADRQNLLGWSCPNFGHVLYIDGELPGAALQERLRKFPSSAPGMFHVLCRDTFYLKKQVMPDLGEAEGRAELDRVIEQCRPDLIIIDSISTLVRTGIENEAESWAPVQDWLLKHRWRGRTVFIIHHEGRSGRPRGTSKREDVLDSMIGLRKKPDDDSPDSVFELSFTKARDFYGADAEPMQIRLAIVDGQVRWTAEKMHNVRNDQICEMLESGMTQTEIAKELNLSKGRVAQIVREIKSKSKTIIKFPRPDPDVSES